MRERSAIRMLYVPLPADLWAQAAYLTMRPAAVREQASAQLVQVAQVACEVAGSADRGLCELESLPAGQQARVVELVRAVLARFSAPANGR